MLPHYIIWNVKIDQKDTPELPKNFVVNNHHVFMDEVEFKISLYADRAVLSCIDIIIGAFLYADPAFPNNLLSAIGETRSQS